MEANIVNNEIRRELTACYYEEIEILKKVLKTIEKLDKKIINYTKKISSVQEKLAKVEQVQEQQNPIENVCYMDMETTYELRNIEKQYQKKLEQIKTYKEEVEEKIGEIVQQLQNQEIYNPVKKEEKQNFFWKWLNTMKKSYADVYGM